MTYRVRYLTWSLGLSLLFASCSLSPNEQPTVDSPLVAAQPQVDGNSGATDSASPETVDAAFPTPTVITTFVAEQEFEKGWAFFIEDRAEIWIASLRQADGGSWTIYSDEFHLELQRSGTELTAQFSEEPPEGKVMPVRGFGWVWANNAEVREALGWGTMPERGQTAMLRYEAGGFINSEEMYIARPGRYFLTTVDGQRFIFDEDKLSFTLDQTDS